MEQITAPEPQPEPQPVPQPAPEPQPALVSVTAPDAEPKAVSSAKSDLKAVSESASDSGAVRVKSPAPAIDASPSQPVPQPAPEPQPEADTKVFAGASGKLDAKTSRRNRGVKESPPPKNAVVSSAPSLQKRMKSKPVILAALLAFVVAGIGGYAVYHARSGGGAVAGGDAKNSHHGFFGKSGGRAAKHAAQPFITTLLPPVGTPVGRAEAAAVYLFSTKRDIRNNNGSFELGLGAANVFPGYHYNHHNKKYSEDALNDIKHPPPKPRIVEGVAYSGRHSLLMESDNNRRSMLIYLRPPYLPPADRRKMIWLSYRIKAEKPGARMGFRNWGPNRGTLGNYRNRRISDKEWTLGQASAGWDGDAPAIRMELTPGKFWIDDIVWSVGKPVEYKVPDAEVIIDIISDTSLVFAGDKLSFTWKYRGNTNRNIKTSLYLRDSIRDGNTRLLVTRKGELSGDVKQEVFDCPKLQRGMYMLAAVVRDAATGKILARDLQRFSVIDDLSKLPHTVDFAAGAMYLFNEPCGFTTRGMWSLDGLYKMDSMIGCRIIRVMKDWMDIESIYGKRDWANRDYQMDTAHKYGCGFMCEIPGVPLEMKGDWKNHCHMVSKKMTSDMVNKAQSESDFIALDPKTSFWMPDVEYMKEFSRTFVERYKDRGLMCIEYKNEVDAIMPAAVNIKQIMSKVYPVMKAAAPDIPIIVNGTGNGRLRYVDDLYKNGGLKCMDGFSFHPYAWATLRQKSLWNVRLYRKRLDEISPDRRLTLAQTEDLWLYKFEMHRILSDWVGGCQFSCGIPWRDYFAKEHSWFSWHANSGPIVPGAVGVSLAAMNAVLAGARCVGCVDELSEDTLIGFFEQQLPGQKKQYAVALCAAYKPGRAMCLENVDLSGLDCQAFDDLGEEVVPPAPGEPILLSDRVVYLRSKKKELLDAFAAPKATWVNYAQAHIELPDDALPGMAKIFTGFKAFGQYCALEDWQTCTLADSQLPTDASALTTTNCPLYPSVGNLVLWKKSDKPYNYMQTTIWSRGKVERELKLSSVGIGEVTVFINGKRVKKALKPSGSDKLGVDWHGVPIELQNGENKIELILNLRDERAVARIQVSPKGEEQLASLYGSEGASAYINRCVTPGVLLSSRRLRGGFDDPYHPDGGLYKLMLNQDMVSYLYFTTDKRHTAEILIEFADGKAHLINEYSFHAHVNRFPHVWRFEGSNDGENWNLLHEELKYNPTRKNMAYKKRLDNQNAYKMYRFVYNAQPFMLAWKGLKLIEWAPVK
jgi:hypothetical protein